MVVEFSLVLDIGLIIIFAALFNLLARLFKQPLLYPILLQALF